MPSGFTAYGQQLGTIFKIAILELFPIVLAVHIVDVIVDIINKQTSKDSAIMVLVRDLVLRHNILFQARHIPGFNNSCADYLSRCQVTKFQQITRRPRCRQISHSNTREPIAEELVSTLNGLLSTSLTDGSRQLYWRAWSVFREFYAQFYGAANPSLPLFPHCIPLFISYLSFQKLAFSTITSYLVAISYVHKLRGFPDPTKSFLCSFHCARFVDLYDVSCCITCYEARGWFLDFRSSMLLF